MEAAVYVWNGRKGRRGSEERSDRVFSAVFQWCEGYHSDIQIIFSLP
jgi:hypothetical protein